MCSSTLGPVSGCPLTFVLVPALGDPGLMVISPFLLMMIAWSFVMERPLRGIFGGGVASFRPIVVSPLSKNRATTPESIGSSLRLSRWGSFVFLSELSGPDVSSLASFN